jgi:hypothetical protein
MGRAGLTIAMALAVAGTALAAWDDDQCVKCHEGEVLPITLGHSFADWRTSVHAKGGVGCEKCHGGDPRAMNADAAHVGVKPASDPDSLVHPTRLPATCGACHPKELAAFEGTVHAKELAAKKSGATCFTCHDAMATSLPTARELSARCGACHDKPLEERAALAVLVSVKTQLYRTRKAVDAAKAANPKWHAGAVDRFHELEKDYHDVQIKWHTFATRDVLQESRELLKLSQGLADEAGLMAHRPPHE